MHFASVMSETTERRARKLFVTAAAIWLGLVVVLWKADSDFRNNVVGEENELGHAVLALSELLSIVLRKAAPEARGGDCVPKGSNGCVVIRARGQEHRHKLTETSAAPAPRDYRSQKFHDCPCATARQSRTRHAPL